MIVKTAVGNVVGTHDELFYWAFNTFRISIELAEKPAQSSKILTDTGMNLRLIFSQKLIISRKIGQFRYLFGNRTAKNWPTEVHPL